MSWMDSGDVRKERGGKIGKESRLSAKDAKLIARTDPDYKSVNRQARKQEKKRGDNEGRKKKDW